MTGIFLDPKVIEALNGLVAVLIAGLGGAAAVGFARLKASMESHLQRATRAAEEAKVAAQSADAQVSNDHSTNIRDDLDRAIETVRAVSDQIGELTGHVGTLADQLGRVETTLTNHGKSLEAVESRVGRIDERGGRMAEEIHDERVAREAAQRSIDEHSHDAHARLHERLDKLEEKVNQQ